MIPTIRLHSQQLINPVFNNPKDLVSWMGGIQAQDYTMSKWAIGIRLKAGNLQTVNEALAKGDILRIHVMRPTWHYVAAEDIRWMLKLSSRRIITHPFAWEPYSMHSTLGKTMGLSLLMALET